MNDSLINFTSDDGTCTQIKEIIYKYYSLNEELKDSLTEGYLWFSNPLDFNDPYDCNLSTTSDCTEEELYKYFIETQQNVERSFLKKRAKYLSINPNERLDLLRKADRHLIDNLGICCFSQTYNSLLMWSHYSNKHTGVCLGFRILEDPELYLRKLIKVEYPERYPTYNWPTDRKIFSSLRHLIGTKSDEWKYEDEIRLFRDDTDGVFRGKINFKKCSLSTIYFGYRCPDESIQEVRSIVENDRNYSNVKFYKVDLRDYAFGVDFKEI